MAEDFTQSGLTYKILPDGCVNIIFLINFLQCTVFPFLFGAMTFLKEVALDEQEYLFGIRFKPAGISAFTAISINKFTDRKVDLSTVETLFEESFYICLPKKKSLEEIVNHMDNYLLHKLPYVFQPDKRIFHAVNLIDTGKGKMTVPKIASETGMGQRHFERKFKHSVGITPKMLMKIFRFQNVLKRLQTYSTDTLYDIAYDCGYYSHTHLIKDFKEFTGSVPSKFLC